MVAHPEIKGGLREASGDEPTVIRSALPRFLALYATLFAAFGVASPFFAAFLAERGLWPEAIGLVLAAGTAVRLVAGPTGGRLADRLGTPRLVLVGYAAAAACVAFAYLPAAGVWAFLLVSVAHATMLAPLTPIADALTLGEAATLKESGTGRRFEYGWVRGAGSAAFIMGTLLSGQAVSRFGLAAIIWLNGVLLGVTAWCAWGVPDLLARKVSLAPERGRGRVVVASARVPPPDAGGGTDPGQPRAARRFRRYSLAQSRDWGRDDRCALVGVGCG